METLRLDNVSKVYPGKNRRDKDVIAVKNFNLVVEDNEFVVFVGPSGCGKSTTLRMIAGLEDISAGDLYIDGERVNDIESNYRNIAMVFQNYALYPHMTAYQNMAFGLKNRHVPKEEIDARIHEAAKILDIEDLLNRKPKAMSGGQRQRVALGRAIVRTPKIFLLDEPLSNLDAKLRSQMRVEINKLYEKLKTTFIYVTHDQVEAMTMGTRIVVMKKGIVQQIDTPTTLYDFPKNRFVAGFLGTPQMNFYEAKLTKNKDSIDISILDYKLSYKLNKLREIKKEYLDGETHNVILGTRPDNVTISAKGKLQAKVSIIEVLGNETLIYADLDLNNEQSISESKTSVVISVKGRSEYKMGDIIKLDFVPSKIHLFEDKNDEESIMLTPRTKRNEIRNYLNFVDGVATLTTDTHARFVINGLDLSKVNDVYKTNMHRVKINFKDAIKLDNEGDLELVYQGKGLLDDKIVSRFDLNTNLDYESSFEDSTTHIYIEGEFDLNIGEVTKAKIDLEKLEIIGDDNLSIYDLNTKEKEIDEYKLVQIEESKEEDKNVFKILKRKLNKEKTIEEIEAESLKESKPTIKERCLNSFKNLKNKITKKEK